MSTYRYAILGLLWVTSAALLRAVLASSVAQDEFELVLLATPDMTHGGVLFDTCAACHGPTGAGASDGSVPAIGGQHFKFVARQLVDYRHGKRWDERMAHFANTHHLRDAQEIADVAAYVNALTPAIKPGIGEGQLVENGAQIYGRLCASCHGNNAEGDSVQAIPRLAGQQYEYLLRQMHAVVERRRPDYSPNHLVLFSRFQQGEFVGVADYLARIGAAR